MTSVTVVIPTVGRPSLAVLLEHLAPQVGTWPVVVVDDRPDADHPLALPPDRPGRTAVSHSGGRGPAAARNLGWQAADTEWVVFLDDDVLPHGDWAERLADDLRQASPRVAGVQGCVTVPLPYGRRPTDWERSTAGLADAAWITASMAYRRTALVAVGGFDERFRRAFREDSDLALRLTAAGADLVRGNHCVTHPVRPAGFWASVAVQRGNADDMLMWRRHGRKWRQAAGAPRGRRRWHLLTTAVGLAAVGAAVAGRRRLATAAGVAWSAATADFAAARILPGPRHAAEVARMIVTSIVIPPVATGHTLAGLVRHATAGPWDATESARPELVLFDRDGTLVVDVPYNGDPARVVPMPGAQRAIRRLRDRGLRLGVVTNQSGVGRGLIDSEQMAAVNARIEALLGPFDVWEICPHDAGARCACRKPKPTLVERACAALGVPAQRTVMVGDIGTDVAAAQAAGAQSVLVPTPATRHEEVAAAPVTAPDLGAAVDLILAGRI